MADQYFLVEVEVEDFDEAYLEAIKYGCLVINEHDASKYKQLLRSNDNVFCDVIGYADDVKDMLTEHFKNNKEVDVTKYMKLFGKSVDASTIKI